MNKITWSLFLFAGATIGGLTTIIIKSPEQLPMIWFVSSLGGLLALISEYRNKLLAGEMAVAIGSMHTRFNGVLDTVTRLDSEIVSKEKEFARMSSMLDDDQYSRLLDRVGALEVTTGWVGGDSKKRERSS